MSQWELIHHLVLWQKAWSTGLHHFFIKGSNEQVNFILIFYLFLHNNKLHHSQFTLNGYMWMQGTVHVWRLSLITPCSRWRLEWLGSDSLQSAATGECSWWCSDAHSERCSSSSLGRTKEWAERDRLNRRMWWGCVAKSWLCNMWAQQRDSYASTVYVYLRTFEKHWRQWVLFR